MPTHPPAVNTPTLPNPSKSRCLGPTINSLDVPRPSTSQLFATPDNSPRIVRKRSLSVNSSPNWSKNGSQDRHRRQNSFPPTGSFGNPFNPSESRNNVRPSNSQNILSGTDSSFQHRPNIPRQLVLYNDDDSSVSSETSTVIDNQLPPLNTSQLFFVQHLSNDTKLLDVPFDSIGQFLALANPIDTIPKDFVKKTRQVFIDVMSALVDNFDDLLLWKKFLYLPIFLFQPFHLDHLSCREEYRQRLATISSDNWDSITLSHLKRRKVNPRHRHGQPVNYDAVTKLVQRGQYSRAMHLLNRQRAPDVAPNIVFDRLATKFPQHSLSTLTPQQLSTLTDFTLLDKTVIEPLQLRRIVQKARSGIKNGMDKLRYEHLQSLVGIKPEPTADELDFCTHLAAICTCIANGDEPRSVSYFLSDSELIGIPKDANDVRPIGIGSVLRKIVCKHLVQHNAHAIKQCFPNQHGMDIGGAERIVHDFNHIHDTHPEWDMFAMDAINAFNSCNRFTGLQHTMINVPGVFKHIFNMYGHNPTHNWFFGKPHGIDYIEAHDGFTQGDTLATFMYCMSIQPFVDGLSRILTDYSGICRFYIDDGNICAPHDVMIQALEYIIAEGPSYGYHLNLNKGSYLLGRCHYQRIALLRMQDLMNRFHINRDVINVHPSNATNPADLQRLTIAYGVKMLGSYIGSDIYIKSQLNSQLRQYTTGADNLCKYNNSQCKLLLLRSCFSLKIHYLMRTTRPELMDDVTNAFVLLQRKVLLSIFNEDEYLSDTQWQLAQFPVQFGGCGILNANFARHAAFCASFISWFKSDENHIQEWIDANGTISSLSSRNIVSFCNCPQLFRSPEITSVQDLLAIQSSASDSIQSKLTNFVLHFNHTDFLSSLLTTDTRFHAMVLSGSTPEAGQWLLSKPNRPQSTFSNFDFAVCVRFRLYMHQPTITRGSLCTCKYHNSQEFQVIDDQGIHPTFGCKKDGVRINTHNDIVDEICRLVKYSGYATKREELDCFRAAFPDNNQRPDISMANPKRSENFPHARLILDVGITCPVHPASRLQLTRDQSNTVARACNTYHTTKMNKYSRVADANQLSFLPLVFESTGRMLKTTTNFLKMSKMCEVSLKPHCTPISSSLSPALSKSPSLKPSRQEC